MHFGLKIYRDRWPSLILKNVVVLNTITKEPIATIGEIEAPVDEILKLFESGAIAKLKDAFR